MSNEHGGPGHHPETAANSTDTGRQTRPKSIARDGVVNVHALAFRPHRGRRSWLFVVRHCPQCHAPHSHNCGPDGGVRLALCGMGSYRLIPLTDTSAGAA